MTKTIYIDTETTGLDSTKCGLTQLSCIVENGGHMFTFNAYIKPFKGATITQEALKITNRTVEQLNSFEEEKEVFKRFLNFLNKHVIRYDKNDKFEVIGYNIEFDMNFLQEFFVRNNDNYMWTYFKRPVCLFKGIALLQHMGVIEPTPNQKLGTLCEKFYIPLEAHDSLEDIRATRELYYKVKQEIKNYDGGWK